MKAARDRSSLARKFVPSIDSLIVLAHQFYNSLANFLSINRSPLVSQHRFSVCEIFSPEEHQLEHDEILCRQNFQRPPKKNRSSYSPPQFFVEGHCRDKHVYSNSSHATPELSLFFCLPE